MINLEDKKNKYNCPGCKIPVAFTLKQAQNEESIKCAGCGRIINLVDQNASINKVLNDVDNSVKSLKRTIKNFGK